MIYFVVIASSLVAGVIQTVTGFGAGIFMMLFLPLFFQVLTASALCGAVTVVLNIMLAWRYRRYINYRQTIVPAIAYTIVSTVVVYFAPYVPKDIMMKVLGVFMIILSIYFLFFPDKVKIKASMVTASICASLSGCTGGLFGIGGPPMVVYFLAATKEKEEYLGTIQFFFGITAIGNLFMRIARGIYTIDMVPMTILGIAGIFVGKVIGQKIIDRINGELMKKIVYIFLGISGVLNLF